MRISSAILVLSAGLVSAQSGTWNGQFCPGAKRLQVVSVGRLHVVSGDRADVAYKYTGRGAPPRIEAASHSGVCTLRVRGNGELALTIPRRVTQAEFETLAGALTARSLSGDIRLSSQAGAIDFDELAGVVTVHTLGGAVMGGRTAGSLRCLSGGGVVRLGRVQGNAVIELAGGEIYVDQADAGLRASTAGNIHVRSAAHDVAVSTTGGLIQVERAGGMVTARSLGGGIEIGQARGVRCESVRGTIRLSGISGAMKVSTGAGQIYATLDGQRLAGDSNLATARGDVSVALPSKLAVTVKALVEGSGMWSRIVSEFPEIRPPAAFGVRAPMVVVGRLNGGGALLTLSAAQGTVYVKRRK